MTALSVRSCGKRPVLPLAFVLFVLFAACGGEADDPGAAPGIEGVATERITSRDHVLGDVAYEDPMPAGGDHAPPPYWLTCGTYEGEVPRELAVHSLEHGAVWIGLGPRSTADDRAAATALAQGRKVIVSDVEDLEAAVELVAWGRRLALGSADDPRAAAFVEQFVDHDDAPEPGVSCDALGDPPTPPALPTR